MTTMIKIKDIPDFDLSSEVATALERAIGWERSAAAARQGGEMAKAAADYDRAGTAYADTGLAFHEQGESELAIQIRGSIQRCRHCATNIRHPKEQRAAATTLRPNCLACDKLLRRYSQDGRTFEDGTPREWGDYGDNRFCGLRCGWQWACRHSELPKLGRKAT